MVFTRTGALIVVVLGIAIGAIGLITAVVFQNAANSMSIWERFTSPSEYDFNMEMVGIGWVVAIVGGIMFIIGLVLLLVSVQSSQGKSNAQAGMMSPAPAADGMGGFCQYCGRPVSPDAVWCPGCGRSLKKQP
ncbi:MAG: zinc ribbon domain-containing protein [Thermoplasmata archaeon]|nr:zinc ribbon domain-containing protein [Thermoplasmata archaeon]